MCINACTSKGVNSANFYTAIRLTKSNFVEKSTKIILQIDLKQFSTKASSDAVIGKTSTDIKSFTAFLTTNYNNPFASGANPQGDGVVLKVDVNQSGTTTIVFNSVPQGGPYYAVLAAFDNTVNNNGNNITKPDNTIQSIDKNWARSTNNVTVLADGSLKFSNNSNQLDISLNLLESKPNNIGFGITITPGKTLPVTGRGF